MDDKRGLKKLRSLLERFSDKENYLFGVPDFAFVFPELSPEALKMLLSRALKEEILVRVCRGVYLYLKAPWPRGLILYHTAARLRSNHCVYLSLESALSDAGVISQVPQQWLTLMTNGRSGVISCGSFGTIEFIHTRKNLADITSELVYDSACRLWRASIPLAIKDMKDTKRSLDLIDWEVVHEFV